MTGPRVALLLLIGFVTQHASADMRVRMTAAPGAERCLSSLTITAQPVDGGVVARTVVAAGTTTVTLPLDGNRRYLLRAQSAECWSESVEADGATTDVTIRMFKAIHARGTFEGDRGRWPETIEGTAFLSPPSESGHPLDCQFEKPAWQCVIPADTALDLRLRPKGFAPLYFWDIATGKDIALEPRQVRSGASISGWIEGPDGKPLHGARISLTSATHAPGEEARQAVRQSAARTNRRGFFQIDGLAEGEYRLVSRADGFSPAVLPVVNLRGGEALVWPRRIVHLPFAELQVTLTPATDQDGKPWYVAVEEVSPLETPPPPPLRYAADADGAWRTRALRNDLYRVRIEDANQSVIETLVVDLSKSGTTTVPITVKRNVVRGVLRFGADPMAAHIRFASMNGRAVQAKTDDQGQFEVSFPAAGKWKPTVFPNGPSGPRITAHEIEVPDSGEDHTIDVILGGSRLRGSVVARDGRKEKAAVHVVRDGKLIAQQTTDDDGTFDFIGIDEGEYVVSAEGNTGSARTQAARVAEGETVELTLRLEPYRRVGARILTPSRAPASGALVRISADRGLSWSDVFAKMDGTFEYFLEDGDQSLLAIVLTHAYPALMTELTPSSEPTLVLQPRGGVLRVPARSHIGRDGVLAPLRTFFVPPSANGLYDGAAYLEPGVYSVCNERALTSNCRSVTIVAGAEEQIP